jgi:uncharacterized protein
MRPFQRQIYLIFEYFIIFFGIPLVIWLSREIIHPSLVLVPITALLILYFRKQEDFSFRELNRLSIPPNILKRVLLVTTTTSVLIVIGVYLFATDDFLNLPRRNYMVWIYICISYPVLSVYLQEIVFRVFLFRRYSSLFVKPWMIIVASGIAFSFAHIIYFNLISVGLTFALGVYLAYIYNSTRNVLLVTIIHSFFGNLVFTIGLGQYFWLDIQKYL